jgi:hypothetical protein
MRVCVVCYEDPDTWILGKFARNLTTNLSSFGVDAVLARAPADDVDINYHIYYGNYRPSPRGNDVLMVTHIDTLDKLLVLKLQMKSAIHAICMSRETMDRLTGEGIAADKISFINPAHDSVIKPRKFRLGIMSKVHSDGRKNEGYLLDIFSAVDVHDFRLTIMGAGWEQIVQRLTALGLEVEYFPQFDYSVYVELIPSLDYLLYLSFDEGSMSFVDAVAAGVATIVPPHGFHLDAIAGLTHPVRDAADTIRVLNRISGDRRAVVDAVRDWTWRCYAEKHLALFNRLVPDASVAVERKIASLNSRSEPLATRWQQFLYVAISWPPTKWNAFKSRIKRRLRIL